MMKWLLAGAIVVLLLLVAYGVNLYLTHIWYREPPYRLSALNSTEALLREVGVVLTPEGEFEFGWMAPRQTARYMDPSWPLPQSIEVSFATDSGEQKHRVTLPVSTPSGFKGEIQVEITQGEAGFDAHLNLLP